jgi:hypothetical protein
LNADYLDVNLIVIVFNLFGERRASFGVIVLQIRNEVIETVDAGKGRIQEIVIGG